MIMPEDLHCLKAIALMGGSERTGLCLLAVPGGPLSTSPQTAVTAAPVTGAADLLTRSVGPDGQYVTVTRKGEDDLRKEYAEYCRVFGTGREESIL